MNSSTHAANRVIGRTLDQMMESSGWIRQFTPKAVHQALWVELSGKLAWPVNTMSTVQVAEDTVSLLRAMGLEPQTNPSMDEEASAQLWDLRHRVEGTSHSSTEGGYKPFADPVSPVVFLSETSFSLPESSHADSGLAISSNSPARFRVMKRGAPLRPADTLASSKASRSSLKTYPSASESSYSFTSSSLASEIPPSLGGWTSFHLDSSRFHRGS
ncbi:unnamed protein product [Phytophthora fragariaefolia]|uniref:Unnamed protein product n=1 Tax=Phytophthora fragariaefolia TaxID=1490495 RepID=A0A9W6Y2G3_9STRA|nr:unnamed protein product [Phytophthora fragariaefolia]